MRITFVLPGPVRIPMGGAKVVYRHAEQLVARGHAVTVVMPRFGGGGSVARLRSAAVWLRDQAHGVSATAYYSGSGVRTLTVPAAKARFLPEAEAVIATGNQTAPWVASLPAENGKGFYFIQNREDYQPGASDALDTWHLPLVKLCIARWLMEEVERLGEVAFGPIPNAVDPGEFFLEAPLSERGPSVAMLYHRFAAKGPRDALAVLEQLKTRVPGLTADLFAARPPSHRVPPWIRVTLRPSIADLRALYNRNAIFLHTSHVEGWGLTPMEAAACGCAVVASANQGVREFLSDGDTALLCPIGNVDALADAAYGLLQDAPRRLSLAEAARERVGGYNWHASTDRLESLLLEHVGREAVEDRT